MKYFKDVIFQRERNYLKWNKIISVTGTSYSDRMNRESNIRDIEFLKK